MSRRQIGARVVHVADTDDVAKWSAALPDTFILCRDIGHLWRPWRASITAENSYLRVLRCGRCRTERSQELSMSGHTLSASYTYPEGYQAPAGTGRIDTDGRDALRLESVLRLLGKDDG